MSSPKPSYSPWTTSPPSGEARARAALGHIAAEPGLQARFLNTLSLLEHIGSRKIMASQSGATLAQDTLKHLAEETRHAFFFKRAAEATARRPLSYGDGETIAGTEARAYMGRLDAFIARTAKGSAAYLYMSLVIELRAIWFYDLYQDVLREAGAGLSLASVLAEEKNHLAEMKEALAALGENVDGRLPDFCAYEETRFGAFLDALERDLAGSSLAAQ